MAKTLVTPPSAEPVTLTEVKTQRRVSGTSEDSELTRLITAAREYVENYTGRALITQVWDLFLDSFGDVIEIPRPPLQGVTTVKYTDTNGTQQTLDSSLYTVNASKEPAEIVPAYNQTWPDIRAVPNAVEIRFTAGYGDASTDVPENLRNAIFLLIGHWHENTEAGAPVSLTEILFGVKAILDQSRVFNV